MARRGSFKERLVPMRRGSTTGSSKFQSKLSTVRGSTVGDPGDQPGPSSMTSTSDMGRTTSSASEGSRGSRETLGQEERDTDLEAQIEAERAAEMKFRQQRDAEVNWLRSRSSM